MRVLITILILILCSSSQGQIVINASAPYRPSLNLLLDQYGSAVAAYSLRKLNTSYSGFCIRVRRDSTGQSESDIGFDSNGLLDTVSLKNFIRNNSGYVVTWYDQSGSSNNATQSTASNQPRIVSSGVIDRQSNIPTLVFADNTDFFNISTTNTSHVVSVAKINTLNAINYIVANTGNSGYYYGGTAGGINGIGVFFGSTLVSLTGEDTNRHLAWYSFRGSRVYAAKDGGSETNLAAAGYALTVNVISHNTTVRSFIGNIQEIIAWNSDISSNKSGIESNINMFYAIY